MGILIRWRIPDTSEVSYNYTYIYRADSELGVYTNIANQAITDNTYFDASGSTTNWYKIRFYDNVNLVWSDYSAAMKGGEFRHYCSTDDVRMLAGLTSSDVTDSQIYDIMTYAMAQLNHDISTKIIRERVSYLDDTRENKIDGSNTTYYIKNWKGHYLGDLDDDGTVDATDLKVYQVASDGTETELTISSVDEDACSITLSSIPVSGVELYITYCYTPVSVATPEPLIKMATSLLTSAWAFSKINVGKAVESNFGNVRFIRHMDSFENYYRKYLKIVEQINSIDIIRLKEQTHLI